MDLTDAEKMKCGDIYRVTETGELILFCSYCGAYFFRLDQIYVHVQKHFNRHKESIKTYKKGSLAKKETEINSPTKLNTTLKTFSKVRPATSTSETTIIKLDNSPTAAPIPLKNEKTEELKIEIIEEPVKETDPFEQFQSDCKIEDYSDEYSDKEIEKNDHNDDVYEGIEENIFVLELDELDNPKELAPKQCKICAKTFKLHFEYDKHMADHDANKPYKCEKCSTGFNSKKRLEQHFLEHKNVESEKYKCDTCAKACRNKSALKSHLKVHNKTYECKVCLKKYIELSTLKIHSFVHTGERPHQCHLCGKGFRAMGYLNTHIKLRHNKPNQVNECNICQKKYGTLFSLLKHQRLHTDIRAYVCEICNKDFKSSGCLRQHMDVHGEKRYKCKFCEMTFAQRSGRRGHEKTNH